MSKVVKKQSDKQQISVAWRFYVVVGVIVFVYAGLLARSASHATEARAM